ncbi:MAG: hypothetical protein RR508_07180 [Oscillospiraceae bacterium]
MEKLSIEFWIQIMMYVLSFGTIYGGVKAQIKSLEEKVNKHNNVIERMYKVEESTKSAHRRIDELREELQNE